ncbi:DUF732 domain-containing protein [Mycobacterium botniense]|uniref:DUF732 domain-containing protein n=1 Tax=Mycobacterium botniense TaxID=84962 RepID=A0A7I9Y036_9MYCO|nr:DUF732 domain-containing protein [Mycobacterium botniense]GFG75425.1 hypothetical protein MBOT_27900 [Mycobacterium botniense]
MRDRDTIDSELRRLAALRRSIRGQRDELWRRQIDDLLDERLAQRSEDPIETVDHRPIKVIPDASSQGHHHDGHKLVQRRGVARRLGVVAALPLSVAAVAAVLVMMLAVRDSPPAAEPPALAPSGAPPSPPSSSTRPDRAAPQTIDRSADIAEKAFLDVLQQQGVPVPNRAYVHDQGHAVCDFLAREPNFAEAVRRVQQSSIWDATESAEFAAGAIVSYCPEVQPSSPQETQQVFGNALSDVQAIQRDLERIRDDLHVIPGWQH